MKPTKGWKPRRRHEMQQMSASQKRTSKRIAFETTASSTANNVRLASQKLDRAQTNFMADLHGATNPKELLESTAIDMHAAFGEAFSAAVTKCTHANLFELGTLLTRCWTDHTQILFGMLEQQKLEHQALTHSFNGNNETLNSFEMQKCLQLLRALPVQARQKLVFGTSSSSSSNNNKTSSPLSPSVSVPSLSPLGSLSSSSLPSPSLSPTASTPRVTTKNQLVLSLEEMYIHLASIRRLRHVMFDEQTRFIRESNKEWELIKDSVLSMSYTFPDIPEELEVRGRYSGYWSYCSAKASSKSFVGMMYYAKTVVVPEAQNDTASATEETKEQEAAATQTSITVVPLQSFDWHWNQFRSTEERSIAHQYAIKIQSAARRRLARVYCNQLRMSFIRDITRVDFENELQYFIELSQDDGLKLQPKQQAEKTKEKGEELAKLAVMEVLWETKRLCRDVSAMWMHQMRDKKMHVEVQVAKTKEQRTCTIIAAQMLEGVSMRSSQLLEHLQLDELLDTENPGNGDGGVADDSTSNNATTSTANSPSDQHPAREEAATDDEVTKLRKKRAARAAMSSSTSLSQQLKNGKVSIEDAENRMIELSMKLGATVDESLSAALMQVQKESRIVQSVHCATQTKISGKIKKYRGSPGGAGNSAHRSPKGGKHKHKHRHASKHGTHPNEADGTEQESSQGGEGTNDEGRRGGEGGGGQGHPLHRSLAAESVVNGKEHFNQEAAGTGSRFGDLFGNLGRSSGAASFMSMMRSKFKKSKPKLPAERHVMNTILEIYTSKIAVDEQSDRDRVPRLKFGKYCYQFFYRRYGLRKLAETHLYGLNASFKKYKQNARIKMFARCCGVHGRLNSDCLDFILYLISKVQSRDLDALDPLEDGSCWLSETRAVNIVRIAADTLSHSGPFMLNTLRRSEKEGKEGKKNKKKTSSSSNTTSPADYDVLLENMLDGVSNDSVPAHTIVETVANALGGGGGSARKVISRLKTRPDFVSGIKHLLPLLTQLDQESVEQLLTLKSRANSRANSRSNSRPGSGIKRRPSSSSSNRSRNGSTAAFNEDGFEDGGTEPQKIGPPVVLGLKSPIELYREHKEKKDTTNNAEVDAPSSSSSPPSSPKANAKPKPFASPPPAANDTNNNDDDTNEDLLNSLAEAWMMNDSQDNYLRGRESYGISVDAVLMICLNQLLVLRNAMFEHICEVFTAFEISQFDKGKDSIVDGICELNAYDFCMLLWSIDPTVSQGKSRVMFEKCVAATHKELNRSGSVGGGGGGGGFAGMEDFGDSGQLGEDEDDGIELDEISRAAFLKVCQDAGMLCFWSKTYGKRPHTTGGQKVRTIEERKKLINGVPLLSSLNPKQKHQLADQFVEQTYLEKEFIITQGEEGDQFFIVKSGSVDVMQHNKLLNTLDKVRVACVGGFWFMCGMLCGFKCY